MAKSEESIRREIHNRIRTNYSNWYIGVTENPNDRYSQHDSPETWKAWLCSSAAVARRIEKRFLNLGCQGGSGGGTNTRYVYIYRH
jgi:hypothetical protein